LGKGTDLADTRALQGRAKRKLISQALSVGLASIAEEKGDTEMARTFWNAYRCQKQLTVNQGRSYGDYCKTRCCALCSSIRKAEIINRYLPEIQTWKDPHFVTLTQKAVPAHNLEKWFFGVNKAFRQILSKYKKRHQRGKGIKLMGIKSLECNFNPTRRTYNPHLHFLVPSKEIADILIMEWQKKWTDKFTSPFAQHKRPVKHIEKDLVETIKYGTKIFTDFDARKKGRMPKRIYLHAIYNIYKAMKPYRLFERFGFNLPKQEKNGIKTVIPAEQCKEFVYAPEVYDWVNEKTGEGLTGYTPTALLEWQLTEDMDTELQ